MRTFLTTLLLTICCLETGIADDIDFNRDIRPLLNQHCVACHGGVKQAGDVSFIYREQAMMAIEPGSPDASTMIDRVLSEDPEERMPPPEHGRKLSEIEVATLRKWIEQGAHWGEHWSFVKPKKYDPPTTDKSNWGRTRIDAFVYDQINANGLQPAKPAAPDRWLRRVSIDLTGVPPTMDERSDFLKAVELNAEAAYEQAVDRLLKSPRFGERWASVWLDAVRYADSRGLGQDGKRTMWKFRDWVIKAFNEDMPFNDFTIKQLAGDLLPDPSLDDLVATACHRLTQTNEEGGTDDEQFRVEAVVDRVNTTWQTWQGLTFGCVQCHSHPYDPIEHDEYYKSIAFFNNTDDWDLTDDPPYVHVPIAEKDYPRASELLKKSESIKRSDWSQSLAMLIEESNWQHLQGIAVSSSSSTQYTTMNVDGIDEYRTVGTVARDTKTTVTAAVPKGIEKITAIRFEGLPVDLEKAKLNAEMGFVISYVEAKLLQPGAEPQMIPLAYVISDEFDAPDDPQQSLNPKSARGFGAFARMNYPKAAAFVLKEPVSVKPNARIEIAISQNVFDSDSFPLVANRGRFSLSDKDCFTDWLNSTEHKDAMKQIQDLDSQLQKIKMVSIPRMRERPVRFSRPTAIFERGDFLNKGEIVQPGTPKFLPPLAEYNAPNRLDFARWIASEENPLTARVTVNRFWAQLFGIGIVETQEDFGSSGDKPSHPELLDDLSARFMDDMRWSVKSLLREIVLSSTYRQSSQASAELVQRDPANRLLARGPRVRLPAETIRDQALAISGLLSETMYGPPTYPPLPQGVWQPFQGGEKYPTPNKGDPERYRKTIYSYTKRSIPLPIMASFDAPSREFCAPRRLTSNTPLQSLMTLNDVTFVEAAEALAGHILKSGGELEGQIRYGFIRTICREPSESELRELKLLYQETLAFNKDEASNDPNQSSVQRQQQLAMEAVAIVLLNLDEIFTN